MATKNSIIIVGNVLESVRYFKIKALYIDYAEQKDNWE
jgi:hypothetical protein